MPLSDLMIDALRGNVDKVAHLLRLVPYTERMQLLSADAYKALRLAAGKGHLDVVCVLLAADLTTEADRQAMLSANGYKAFQLAACLGHDEVCIALLKVANKSHKSEMLLAGKASGFRQAAYKGYFKVVQALLGAEVPDRIKQEMLLADGGSGFFLAVSEKRFEIIHAMGEAASPATKHALLTAEAHAGFRAALNHPETAVELLCWAYRLTDSNLYRSLLDTVVDSVYYAHLVQAVHDRILREDKQTMDRNPFGFFIDSVSKNSNQTICPRQKSA